MLLLLEKYDFHDIVISMKSSTVGTMIQAYELVSQQCDYPLHLGVTESGTVRMGIIKSAVGIGALLTQGIGDTIRVSLTADPVREVYAGYDILSAIDLKPRASQFVPARPADERKIDLLGIANEVEERLRRLRDEHQGRGHGLCRQRPGRSEGRPTSASPAATAADC